MGLVTADAAEHVWKANPRQLEVFEFVKTIPEGEYGLIGYGGAAGGAKTNLLANFFINVSLKYPGARSLIGRNELVHLKSTTLEEFDKNIPPGILVKKRDGSPITRMLRDPSWPAGVWSTVFFAGVKDARNKIGSEEFGWVGLDEAHEIEERDIRYLFTRLRHKPEKTRGMVICFNPFPCCAVEWFMNDEGIPEDMLELGNIHQTFIPARISDNAENLPPGYESMMYAGLDPYLRAVMIEGRSEAVPNAIFGMLNDPDKQRMLRVQKLPEELRWTLMITGWDWGTSIAHKAAGVLIGIDSSGILWFLDAWESPFGSSNELFNVARGWREQWRRATGQSYVRKARYDASQGSLADDLKAAEFESVDKGIRDVEGRIRMMRGLLDTNRVRFFTGSEGVRQLWRYYTLYHRDDDDRIVEEKDDMVDASLYAAWEAEHPTGDSGSISATGIGYRQQPSTSTPRFPQRSTPPRAPSRVGRA